MPAIRLMMHMQAQAVQAWRLKLDNQTLQPMWRFCPPCCSSEDNSIVLIDCMRQKPVKGKHSASYADPCELKSMAQQNSGSTVGTERLLFKLVHFLIVLALTKTDR